MRKPTTLMAGKPGSRQHFGTKPYLQDAMRLTEKERPLALYVGAASRDDPSFGSALAGLLERAGADRVLWPKLTGRRKERAKAREALAEVDFVFLGGGDVEAGMDALRDAQLVEELHAAAARGVVFAGMSAGSVMLGERWIRWPREDAGDEEAETYACLGLAPCCVDTHGEGEGWQETQSFAAVRARELGAKACAYAVPSGAALVVDHEGKMQARGAPVPVFAALPNEKAHIEKTLEAVP
ncbi:MAG TPA: Type 1 glutamine amidotransferase-like domain-containing protein [Gammaproteobacteria bacterium]|nr:Type 1 glutamine amidotransferase-like domain-containing protein [Gammaproteobacteria bacterium]